MTVHYFQADCPEWHKLRSKYVTGSDLASLFGLNPQRSIESVLAEKFEGEKFILPSILAMYLRRGRLMESSHFVALAEEGYTAYDAAPFLEVKYVTHDKCKLATSMDGIFKLNDVEYPLELKTTGKTKWNKIHTPAEKRVFFIQNIAQAMCLGAGKGYLNCLEAEFPHNIKLYKVNVVTEVEKLIIKTVKRFWKERDKFTVNDEDRQLFIDHMKNQTRLVYETDYQKPDHSKSS